MRRLRYLLVALALAACAQLDPAPPADHIVAAPISKRANVVLRNLVTECGSTDGRWLRDMGPGCPVIWATQFGYRAGKRRGRADVLVLGKVTATRASADIRGLAWDTIFGDADVDDPAVFGFPALMISGSMGGSSLDAALFLAGLDRLDEFAEKADRRESAGLAVVLAEVATLQPGRRDERLAKARGFAEKTGRGGGGAWSVMAWAAVARASGEQGDLDRALKAVEETDYRFDESGALATPPQGDVLSRHLSMAHGLADLAQASGRAEFGVRARGILDYVFSDAYFDGEFIVHDRLSGRSVDVCSGCNFMALYLVDRLYGDSFVIDPVPPLPLREHEEEEEAPWPPRGRWDRTFLVGGDEQGRVEVVGLDPVGSFLFAHAVKRKAVSFRYEAGDTGIKGSYSASQFPFSVDVESAYDAEGKARFEEVGFPPVVVTIEFSRVAAGRLDAVIDLAENYASER